MLLLSSAEKLQVITDAAVAVDVQASFVDMVGGTVPTPRAPQLTAISTVATTDVVAAPAAGDFRNIQTFSVRNKGTSTVKVTIQYNRSATLNESHSVTLFAGQKVEFLDGDGWTLYDARGNKLSGVQPGSVPLFYDAQRDFGFVGDLQTVADGACNSGTPTKITSATAGFVATDVGKRITLPGAGASGAQYTGAITAVDSGTQVTVSPNVATTVSAKILSFGTDNSAAITAMVNAINNAVFPGAKIIFGKSQTNAYGFPSRVVFNKACQVEGIGGGHTTDTGDYARIGGTRLAWWGTDSDSGVPYSAFFEFSATGVQALKRVAMKSCWLDCRNGDQNPALIGLKLMSCHAFMLEDFFIMDPLAIALYTNISSTPTEAKDTTRFSIRDFCVRVLDNLQAGAMTTPIAMTSAVALTTTPQSLTVAANTLPTAGYAWVMTACGYPVLFRYTGGGGTTTLTGCVVAAEDVINAPATVNGSFVVQATPANACAMMMDGSTTANTCCGVVQMVQLSHGATWGPAAIELRNSDSISWIHPVVNGGNATVESAINRVRKPGCRMNGSNTNDTLACRNQVFRGGSMGAGGISAMGVLNTAARMSAMSGPNMYREYEMGNGEAIPIQEGNCYFDWQPNGGFGYGIRGTPSVADQAIAAATLTLITGSLIAVPPQGFQIGTKFRWKLKGVKTAAGVAARNFFIKIGTAGATGDGTVATFLSTLVVTGAIDNGTWEFELSVRGPLGASCAGLGWGALLAHQTAGLAPVGQGECYPGTTATWNSATAKLFIGLYLTTGASEAITVQSCSVTCENPSNP